MANNLRNKIIDIEERHRLIADNLLDAIWIVDAETLKFEYITASIDKISGYSAEEYKDLRITDRLTPESFRKITTLLADEKAKYKQGLNSKNYRTLEMEIFHKNGETYWAEVRVKLVNETGNGLKIVGATRGITDRKRAEHEQDDLIRQLGEALAEKEKLLQEIRVLRGLLPICSGCKRIRDENDNWWPLDAYVKAHTDAEITHTICGDCAHVIYKEM